MFFIENFCKLFSHLAFLHAQNFKTVIFDCADDFAAALTAALNGAEPSAEEIVITPQAAKDDLDPEFDLDVPSFLRNLN